MSHASEWTAGFTQHTMDMPPTFFMFIVTARVWEHGIERQRLEKRDRVVILLSSGRCLHWFPKAPDIFMSLAGKMLLFTVYVLGISCHGNGFRALLKPMKAGLPREMSGTRDKLLWRLSDDDLSMYMFALCVSVQFCLSSDKIYANIWIKHWNEIKIFKHIRERELLLVPKGLPSLEANHDKQNS